MRRSQRLVDSIKEAEGLRLEPYVCPSGLATCGWGHTKDVKLGQSITLEQAEAFLDADIADAEALVQKRVTVPLTQGQYDALVSFVYNIRKSQFNEKDCTLLRLLNQGDYSGAADQFKRWVHGAGGVVLGGLVKRRAMEEAWFREG